VVDYFIEVEYNLISIHNYVPKVLKGNTWKIDQYVHVLCVIGIIDTQYECHTDGDKTYKNYNLDKIWGSVYVAPAMLLSSSASSTTCDGTFKFILPCGYQTW
jgi:hypothetical protein